MSTLRTALLATCTWLTACGGLPPTEVPPKPIPVADAGGPLCPAPADSVGGKVAASVSFGYLRGVLQAPTRQANVATVTQQDDIFISVRFAAPVPPPYTVAITPVTAGLLPLAAQKTADGFLIAAFWIGSGATVRWPQINLQDYDVVVVR